MPSNNKLEWSFLFIFAMHLNTLIECIHQKNYTLSKLHLDSVDFSASL